MIRILIHGIMGRMGRAVYATALAQSGAFSVVAGVDVAAGGSDFACPVYTSLDDVRETPDIIIDFTVPATLPNTWEKAIRALCSPFCIRTSEGTTLARPM